MDTARPLDCGDNSCYFATKKVGMRTNGSCRCLEDYSRLMTREQFRDLIRVIRLTLQAHK